MKTFAIVLIVLHTALAEKSLYELFQSTPDHIENYYKCLPTYRINVDAFVKKIHEDRPKLSYEEGECSATCFAKVAGFLYEDGTFNEICIQKILKKPSPKVTKLVSKAVDSCMQKFGVESCHYLKCVTDKIFTEEDIKELFSIPQIN